MRRGRGFSLVELLVVLAIMGVLATVAVPLAELQWRREREAALREALREIRTALDAYKRAVDEGRVESAAGSSGYPPNLEILAEGAQDRRSVGESRLYFIRSLPADPFAPPEPDSDSNLSAARRAARTWALRSYASSGTDPRPGNDVYDVHSRADGIGLDGRPYKEW